MGIYNLKNLLIQSRLGNNLSRLCDFILFCAIALCSGNGFGSRDYYNYGVIISLIVMAIDAVRVRRDYFLLLPVLALLIISIGNDSILQATSLLVLLLILFNRSIIAASLLFSSIVPFFCFLVPCIFPSFLLSPLITSVLYFSCFFLLMKFQDKVCKVILFLLCMVYALFLAYVGLSVFEIDKCPEKNMPPGYNTGNTLEKILEKELPENGTLYYANQQYTSITNTGTVYLDHDSCTKYDGGEFVQESPWSKNQLIAIEPLRVNVVEDGCLVLNLGSKIEDKNLAPLWGQSSGLDFNTLCAYDGSRLIFGDSDMAGDMLSPYQANLWRQLCGLNLGYRIWLCLVCTVVFTTFFFIKRRLLFCLTVLCIVILFRVMLNLTHLEGGVRYVGDKVYYPHSTLCYGVVRAFNKLDVLMWFSNKNAKVLAIGAGHCATHDGEKIIVLEPGAKVMINGRTYSAGILPMGTVNQIVDAREIVEENKRSIGVALYETSGVIIIATGSPASIDFRPYL